MPKKRNAQDSTLRNVRAAHRGIAKLTKRLVRAEQQIAGLRVAIRVALRARK